MPLQRHCAAHLPFRTIVEVKLPASHSHGRTSMIEKTIALMWLMHAFEEPCRCYYCTSSRPSE